MSYKMLFALCLGFMVFATMGFKKAEGEKEFIMCIVHGDYNQEQALVLANEFKEAYPVVSMSRLDGISKKFYILYEADKITRDNVIDFFAGKKLHATCLHKGIYGKDAVPNITAEECK